MTSAKPCRGLLVSKLRTPRGAVGSGRRGDPGPALPEPGRWSTAPIWCAKAIRRSLRASGHRLRFPPEDRPRMAHARSSRSTSPAICSICRACSSRSPIIRSRRWCAARSPSSRCPRFRQLVARSARRSAGRCGSMRWSTARSSANGILNLGRRDARGRIAHVLCELAARMEAADLLASSDDVRAADHPGAARRRRRPDPGPRQPHASGAEGGGPDRPLPAG